MSDINDSAVTEIWKDVVGYEGLYRVSNLGRVESVERMVERRGNRGKFTSFPRKILKEATVLDGRKTLSLCKDGKPTKFYVYRLVLAAFVGPCPEGMEACHNDGNPGNNSLDNLRWDTHSSNMLDTIKHGTYNYECRTGENHPKAKITEEDVREIREAYSSGKHTQVYLAEKYKMCKRQIYLICSRKNWRHVE